MKTFASIAIVFLSGIGSLLVAQERVLTFGLQFKPIIPSDVITDKSTQTLKEDVNFSLTNRLGYSFGMAIRRGFTDRFSFETGINYVSRNFSVGIEDQSTSLAKEDRFTIIGYEVPVLGLVYVQLSDEIFMNAAFGASLDFFPSDVGTNSEILYHESQRRAWFMPSLLANIGWEYRTRKKGYWYIGGSFHRPFTNIYFTGIRYQREHPASNLENVFELTGSYLTLDLRYFFHEEPLERKKAGEEKDLQYYRKKQRQRRKNR